LAALIIVAAAIGAFLPGAAFADVWCDIADATWQSTYGVSAQAAWSVAQGRSDGTFGPNESVNRGQFAKMATTGLAITASLPEVATFTDVPDGHVFFSQVEQCTAAGVMSGYADGTFRPDGRVTHEQTCSVLARWLAGKEIEIRGGIVGTQGTYASLRAWFTAEGAVCLAAFADAGLLSQAHRITTAYLVCRGVIIGGASGSSSLLTPTVSVNRAQAVALILRVRKAATSFLPAEPDPTPTAEPTGPTAVVLTGGQTPLKGVWSGTAEQLTRYFVRISPTPLFSVPTSVLAGYYVRYAAEAGLRADVLWAQMIHETGYGMYGGDVLPEQNNYAGIGATGGGVQGASFPTAEAGVMAHVAHMVAYVYTESPVDWANAITDPRFDLVWPRGVAVVLADLNGRWAVPGTTYGQAIEAIARAINAD
jgi:hypothetical protein